VWHDIGNEMTAAVEKMQNHWMGIQSHLWTSELLALHTVDVKMDDSERFECQR
jgi:hypothetical protein